MWFLLQLATKRHQHRQKLFVSISGSSTYERHEGSNEGLDSLPETCGNIESSASPLKFPDRCASVPESTIGSYHQSSRTELDGRLTQVFPMYIHSSNRTTFSRNFLSQKNFPLARCCKNWEKRALYVRICWLTVECSVLIRSTQTYSWERRTQMFKLHISSHGSTCSSVYLLRGSNVVPLWYGCDFDWSRYKCYPPETLKNEQINIWE